MALAWHLFCKRSVRESVLPMVARVLLLILLPLSFSSGAHAQIFEQDVYLHFIAISHHNGHYLRYRVDLVNQSLTAEFCGDNGESKSAETGQKILIENCRVLGATIALAEVPRIAQTIKNELNFLIASSGPQDKKSLRLIMARMDEGGIGGPLVYSEGGPQAPVTINNHQRVLRLSELIEQAISSTTTTPKLR